MKITLALFLDAAILGVICIAAFTYMRKGFVSGVVRFLGNLLSLFASLFVANKVSPLLFEKFFYNGLIAKTQDLIEVQGVNAIEELVQDVASFLPIDYVQKVVDTALSKIDAQSASLAKDIVETAVKPLFVPIISVVLFFIMYTVCIIIVSQIANILINLNKIPLVGSLNKFLGLGVGVLYGVLQSVIILCAIWAFMALTNNNVPFVNDTVMSNSIFYSLFSGINPFLKI